LGYNTYIHEKVAMKHYLNSYHFVFYKNREWEGRTGPFWEGENVG
jgi:hypothetical protein